MCTYAWFVQQTQVKATTTSISAQSNSAYLLIDSVTTSKTSTSSKTAAETIGASGTYSDAALYPAQWKNNFNKDKANGTSITDENPAVYQFESAFASAKDAATMASGTLFAVGSPAEAVTADYAILNTFYIGTGTYDGEFKDLKISGLKVTDTNTSNTGLENALRVLVETYAPVKSGETISYPNRTAWAVAYVTGDGESQALTFESQSGENGIIFANQFGKSEGDVLVKVYVYYDGNEQNVKTTNLEQLITCGATITFDATKVESAN